MQSWKKLNRAHFESVGNLRKEVHAAVQTVAALGRSYSPRSNDDEFATLHWDPEQFQLVGRQVEQSRAETQVRAAFSFKQFSIRLLDASSSKLEEIYLAGKKKRELMIWLEEKMAMRKFDTSSLSSSLPYVLPNDLSSGNLVFSTPTEEKTCSLGRCYHNANLILSKIVDRYQDASAVTCRPEHLDISTSITLKDNGDSETSTSISVGMSPGSAKEPTPYFYVLPWPYPTSFEILPRLPEGQWVNEEWVGAKLDLLEICQYQVEKDQQRMTEDFLESAIMHLKQLLLS